MSFWKKLFGSNNIAKPQMETLNEPKPEAVSPSDNRRINSLFQEVPIEVQAFNHDEVSSLRHSHPNINIVSTTIISSRYPETNPDGVSYISTGEESVGIIRFDRKNKEYRDLTRALQDGKVWMTVKTYNYESYPILQFIVRIYRQGDKKPLWWHETLANITYGDIQGFISDACRNRKWKFVMARYNPCREEELDEMIDLNERVFTLSEQDANKWLEEAENAVQYFLKIPNSKRNFSAAAQNLMEDDPPVEGI